MKLLYLFKTVFSNLQPAGSVAVIPFLTIMLLSLTSSLYTIHQMLRRKSIGETFLAMVIPYVLFGTLFLAEPLITASLFATRSFMPAVILIMRQRRLYIEILFLIAIFFFFVWLFAEAASRRMGGTRGGQMLRNCGWEMSLCIPLVGISIMGLFQLTPDILSTMLGLKIFIYAILAVAIKTAVNLFLVLYTILFRFRVEEKPGTDLFSGQQDLFRVRRYVRRKAKYVVSLLGLFLALFGYAISRSVGFSLLYVNILLVYLCFLWLYHLLRFLWPDMTTLRRLSQWGDENHIAALFCQEVMDTEPVIKKEDYTITAHFLVDESRFGLKIYYLPLLEHQRGQRLYFSDGSHCRLRTSLQGLNMIDYVKNRIP